MDTQKLTKNPKNQNPPPNKTDCIMNGMEGIVQITDSAVFPSPFAPATWCMTHKTMCLG